MQLSDTTLYDYVNRFYLYFILNISVAKIGALLKSGELTNITAIPTSKATEAQARELGIPLVSLSDLSGPIDLCIDGADEVSPDLQLVKGWGGALLREKLVEINGKDFICIVDHTKCVQDLGKRGVPVEVTPFESEFTRAKLERTCRDDLGLPCVAKIRGGSETPYVTDNGNYIVDCSFADGIPAGKVELLANTIKSMCGVIEHGFFLNMASRVVVATPTGIIVRNAGDKAETW
jgi:ribose 5-phosphate isomerase A